MTATKLTIMFEQANLENDNNPKTTNRLVGWSESFYNLGEVGAALTKRQAEELCRARARLLSTQAYVKGYRLQQVDPVGKTLAVKFFVKGTTSLDCDDPNNALLWQAHSPTKGNRRILIIRGVPDEVIATGSYNRGRNYDNALRQLWTTLQDTWMFRGKKLDGGEEKLLSVSALGVATLKAPLAFVVGDKVQVLRTIAPGHRAKGHSTTIAAVGGPSLYTLTDWPHGATTGGKIRKDTGIDYFNMELSDAEIVNPRVTDRDTGRPFNQSRGRRSAQYR